MFKSLQGQTQPCLAEECQLITNYPGLCHLRSANANVSIVPRTSTRLRDRSFCVAGPRVWNSLSSTLRQPDMDFDTAPSYLDETLHLTADVVSRRRLRSASKSTLVVPSTRRITLGNQAFPVAAAVVECSFTVCSFCAIAAAVPPRPKDVTVPVIVLFTIVSSCVTD